MKELYNALPDDRPINAVCVVEDVSKCPAGFTVVGKSYDQDLDADLWKDGFFGKRVTRYLCLSKSEGPSGFVIDSLCVINERDSPPNGYILLAKTWRSEQKAWRKRQLCYRLSPRSDVILAVTDIIILSKSKKAPEGFTLAGDMHGLLICYKSSPLPPESNYIPSIPTVNLPPAVSSASEPPQSLPSVQLKPVSPSHTSNGNAKTTPVRPAPLPPRQDLPSPSPSSPGSSSNHTQIISSSTLSGYTGLEGVPFALGPRVQLLSAMESPSGGSGRRIRLKTAQELHAEYQYPFFTERSAILRL